MKKLCLGFMLITTIISTTAATNNFSLTAIENFTNLASSRNVQISPDGKHFTVVLRKDGEDLLAMSIGSIING